MEEKNEALKTPLEVSHQPSSFRLFIFKYKWIIIGVIFIVIALFTPIPFFSNALCKPCQNSASCPPCPSTLFFKPSLAQVLYQIIFPQPVEIYHGDPINLPTPTQASDPTANWKTYQDPKGKYFFKYSLDLIPLEISNGFVYFFSKEEDLQACKGGTKSLQDIPCAKAIFIFQAVKTLDIKTYTHQVDPAIYQPQVFIDSQNRIWKTDMALGQVYNFTGSTEINDKVYVVSLQSGFLKLNDQEYYRNLFDQILSTFKFLDETNKTDPRRACINAEGRWLAEYSECESSDTNKGLSQVTCTQLGGQYDECESTCRHNPNAQVCITVCVGVCRFN